jgi:large subunit ribosomal protein L30
MSELKICLVKSLRGRYPNHVRIATALGLSKIRQTVIKPDSPVIRGMVKRIEYLIEIEIKG